MNLVKCIVSGYDWIKKGETCLFMGEIENMKGHGVFAHKGKVFVGFHLESFEKIKE